MILKAVNAGEPGAESMLVDLVYGELRKIAEFRLRASLANQSVSPTVPVNEAYMKLFGHHQQNDWNGRGHFFSVAAHAMRQILIDHARRKRSLKRGGDCLAVEIDLTQLPNLKKATANELVRLDEALSSLAEEDTELVDLVELKFFGGYTTQEAAELSDISLRTANRRWQYARSRLWQLMSSDNATH